MQRKLIWKLVLIVGVMAVAALSLYPLDKKLKLGLDLAGGTVFVYQIDVKPGQDAKTVVDSVIEVLRKRVDPKGVKNLIWRALAGNRIEIQVPLAPKQTTELRDQFTEARDLLFESNLSRGRLDSAMRLAALQRQAELQRIAGSNQNLLDDLNKMARAFDVVVEAATAFDRAAERLQRAEKQSSEPPEAVPAAPDADAGGQDIASLVASVQQLGAAERAAQGQLAQIRNNVLAWNVDASEWQAVEATIEDWPSLKPAQQATADNQFTDVLTALVDQHTDRADQIRSAGEAYRAYANVKGPLDDPNDLKALLRGAGVLEFRIAPLPSDLAETQINEYRTRLTERGPRTGAHLPYRWFEVDDLTQFADIRADRDRLDQIGAAAFFAGQGLVAHAHRQQYYLLLGSSGDDSMTEAQEGWELTNARISLDQNGFPAVGFTLNPAGAGLMQQMTGSQDRIGTHNMAIVLDGRVITAPRINDKLASSIEVSRGGGFSAKDQQYLVNTLNAGTLQAQMDPEPISENTVGPLLGQDNLEHGLKAALWALIIVALFIAGYYLFAGLVADFALMANMALILGTMATLQATFTLPGIAGIVLTIGMAVDANVLIFERIREELADKVDIRTAVRLGYQKALVTIVDANLTTLIICLILGYTATAEIKGFAVTLGIGIVATLFTALFCTRVIVELALNMSRARSLPMLPTLAPGLGRLLLPNINWIGRRHIFMALSAGLIIVGLIMVSVRRQDMFDIEFRAGTKVAFMLKPLDPAQPTGLRATLALGEVRRRLNSVDALTRHGLPTVVTLGPTERQGGQVLASSFMVSSLSQDRQAVSDAVKAQLEDVLNVALPLSMSGVAADFEAPPLSRQLDLPPDQRVVVPFREFDQVGFELTPQDRIELSDYLGGVLIRLRNVAAEGAPDRSVGPREVKRRITRMRGDAKFEHVVHRTSRVIAETTSAAPGGGYRSMVVLVGPTEHADYADPSTDSIFYQDANGLAATEWSIVHEALRRDTSLDSVSSISPQVSRTMKNRAIVAMVLSLLAIVAYIWLRFGSLRYGLAALAALVHDVLIALGLVAMCGIIYESPLGQVLGLSDFKVNLALVAALLTIVGYSLNDTIVIFDRIRENRGRLAAATGEVINASINQTISRTVLTSGTTLLALLTLYIFGGEGVHGFAFAMIVGVVVGTYSSIAIAAPLLLFGGGVTEKSAVAVKPATA